MELAKEKEELVFELERYQEELEGLYKTNKNLKKKNGRLEEVIYGRKIVK